jgi:hypothetical protein
VWKSLFIVLFPIIEINCDKFSSFYRVCLVAVLFVYRFYQYLLLASSLWGATSFFVSGSNFSHIRTHLSPHVPKMQMTRFYYNYKPFYVFNRFKLRDVYLSVCRRYLLPLNCRFLRSNLFIFGIVGKVSVWGR